MSACRMCSFDASYIDAVSMSLWSFVLICAPIYLNIYTAGSFGR